MILDKETLVADNIAYSATAETLDLMSVRPGPGEPIRLFAVGSSNLTGCTGLELTHCDTEGGSYTSLTTVGENIAGKIIEFNLPSSAKQFIKVELSGSPTAGTWSCGTVLEGVQLAE